jgi:L-rhamnose mutarotase
VFLDNTDGSLSGSHEVEVDDDEAAQASLAASSVATEWESEMSRFFAPHNSAEQPANADQAARRLDEVFDLCEQLRDTPGISPYCEGRCELRPQ